MSIIRYIDKKILVIDDLAQMRSSLRSMVNRLGVEQVDTVGSGEDAIALVGMKSFDIILCDYELGKGKDGQQVLEEMRHSGLLKHTSIFVLVTAAQTVDMVLGAIENEPDGYIAKPVTFDELKARLERIIKLKQVYEPINAFLDEHRIDDAIEECNKLIGEKPKLALNCYRIKAKLLFESQRYEEAKDICNIVVGIRHIVWAQLGLAKSCFYLDEMDEAENILNELIKENDSCVEAHDWIAQIHKYRGDYTAAQLSLQKAIERSPKSVKRQTLLGEAAKANEDWSVASTAFRKSVALGKHSCFKEPENYLNTAATLQPIIKTGNSREKRAATLEANKTLKDLKFEYNDDLGIQVQATMLEGETHFNIGNLQEAKSTLRTARVLYQKYADEVGDTDAALGNELIDAIKSHGDPDEVILLEQTLLAPQGDAKKAVETARKRQLADNMNNDAAGLYEQGKIKESVELFVQAMQVPEASHSVLLNALQSLVIYMQKNASSKKLKAHCAACIERLSDLPKDDERYERFERLQTMYTRLK